MAHANYEQRAESVYQLLLRCGEQRTRVDFCTQLITELSALVPYDQARILFLDKSGKISGAKLFGVKKHQWEDFMHYYENDLVTSKYSLKEPMHLSASEKISVQNYWYNLGEKPKKSSVFVDDYVYSLHLYHSLGIGMSDQENCIRSIFVLDRTCDTPFSNQEVTLLRGIHPLLENYHIDLLLNGNAEDASVQMFRQTYFLTKREIEIVGLLMEGLTPAQISQRISVSVATVYRHIANIYQKCHVSNRQELQKLFLGQEIS